MKESFDVASSALVKPWTLRVTEQELDDLKDRLARVRWPDRETVSDASQGATLSQVRALCEYWRSQYDWRRCEAMLNGFSQYRTTIDGLDLHFLHIRSRHPGALPLIMTHGWPGSIIEFHKVIGPLTDPLAHGGVETDAFHVVIPSLPGFGFSGKPENAGWGLDQIARAWATLMSRLGYRRWVAQGGDWGAAVTNRIAMQRPAGCIAIHVNTVFNSAQPGDENDHSPIARLSVAKAQSRRDEDGYAQQQSTRPQTLGYGLADSPVGQAAWIFEKLQAWTDNSGNVEDLLTRDEILDDIMLYWLGNAGASSARIYWESYADLHSETDLPAGVSLFLNDTQVAPREWVERTHRNLVYWSEVDRGGHFAAFEQPLLFVREMRRFLAQLSESTSSTNPSTKE